MFPFVVLGVEALDGPVASSDSPECALPVRAIGCDVLDADSTFAYCVVSNGTCTVER